MCRIKVHLILILVTLGSLFSSAQARVYSYDGKSRMVGNLEYAIVDENCNNIHDLARQYNVGYDALMSANPHLTEDSDLKPGLMVYIPNKVILPKTIKPNTVLVNIAEKRLFFYDDHSHQLFVYPVGVGRVDHPSPLGKMSITLKRYKPIWHVPSGVLAEARENGYTDHPTIMRPGPDNPLGQHAIHLSAQTYLIHSTNNPDLIGTRNTSGCINLYPEHIAELYGKVQVKTPVEIVNSPLKTVRRDGVLYVERYTPLLSYSDDVERFDAVADLRSDVRGIYLNHSEYDSKHLPEAKVDKLAQIMQNPVSYPVAIVDL